MEHFVAVGIVILLALAAYVILTGNMLFANGFMAVFGGA